MRVRAGDINRSHPTASRVDFLFAVDLSPLYIIMLYVVIVDLQVNFTF